MPTIAEYRRLHVSGPAVLAAVWIALFSITVAAADDTDPPVSFRTDVMAVLSKAGCNMGVCHGNKFGKGGFKLSLRGEDPAWDFAVLSRDQTGRRINPLEPDASLALLKPTMQVPHEGGRRFTLSSPEYSILRRWIAAGQPADSVGAATLREIVVEPRDVVVTEPDDCVQLHVTATFSDGVRRDVTGLAVYDLSNQMADVGHDGLVRRRGMGTVTVVVRYLDKQAPVRLAFVPARPGFAWEGPAPTNYIDERVFARLKELRINPSPVCSDTVFVRRAFLDLLGILPTADEARAFVAETRSDKRSRLIDELLERQEFADFWALKWSDLLRNEEKTLDRKGVQNFHAWIRAGIARDKPLDQFARGLIAARGSTYLEPAANYYRAMRDPIMRAESTAQIFLGTRLQCSKCHNHPFDRWTQDDYYSWANLFARVEYRVLENRRRDMNDSHEFDGEQLVVMARKGDVKDPRTDKPLPPRFLGDAGADLPADTDRLLALADWLASAGNQRFVETTANRIWFHLLGQGIVDPIDDFRATNPPSNPQLLAALSADLVEHHFSLRHLVRTIMNSKVYQLSAATNETNREDEVNFSRARESRLSAEQMVDALAQVADVPIKFSGYPDGLRAGELPGVNAGRDRDRSPGLADQFLKTFGKPPRLQACECERTGEPTLSQAFQLVSGPLVNELLSRKDNRLGRLIASGRPTAGMVDELFWTTLSRPPTDEERRAAQEYIESTGDRRAHLEDLLWGLINSNDFLLRK